MKTERLILRRWTEADIEPFARLNKDPVVMEHFPSTLTFEQSLASYQRFQKHFEKYGWGLWAVEVPGLCPFIGFIGLNTVEFTAPFTPAVEIGWRLAKEHWRRGYATEGALRVLAYAFETAKLDEVVSFTTTTNIASQAVMKKIGMHHDPKDDFDHPRLPIGHKLSRHVLYRLKNKRVASS